MSADTLQLGIRAFDPKQKADAKKAVAYLQFEVPREDATMKLDDFIAKHVRPALASGQLKGVLPLDST